MQEITNPFQALNNVFLKPKGVFFALKEKNNWSWIPFFIVILMAIMPSYLYYNFVDFSWFTEMLVEVQVGDKSPAEQDAFRSYITPDMLVWQSVIGGLIAPILFTAIVALYLHLVTKSDESNLNGFTDWYGFVWWMSLPMVINSIVAIFLIFIASDHQISPNVLSPLSPAYWFGIDMGSKWSGLLQGIRLDSIWSIYLGAVGISQWTSFSSKKSLIVAAVPSVVIYTIIALIAIAK